MTMPQVEDCAKRVEKLLKKISISIGETEANVEMFTEMTRCAIATNDVRSFVVNQARLKRRSKGLNKKLIKKT